ncbi:MAG: rhomboid family intramembrane serine protease, partial [Gemmatimonadaceae bacterium]|nr:rhomboid family intramembrane serine protease [Gemmatimonadaceae bacterium]
APSPAPVADRPARDGQAELDRVLDKISESGLESLTADERKLLEERSRELRGR